MPKGCFCWHRDVKIGGIDDHVLHRPLYPGEPAADDLHPDVALDGHLRDLITHDAAIARIHHLVGSRKICPELEAPDETVTVTLWHFLVDDTTACGHPLHV